MEALLTNGLETVMVLAAILTVGAILGAIAGRLTFGAYVRKGGGKLKAHDRLRDDTDRIGKYAEGQWRYGPPSVDLQDVMRKAILEDRSARSRKGWQTRKERDARRAQQDADIRVLIGSDGGAR